MSTTTVLLIVAATSSVIAIGTWIVKDTEPKKSNVVKNVMSVIIVLLFAVTAGSLISAISSSSANSEKSRQHCVDVDNGYVVALGGVDYCFEEPPKLIRKI